MSHKPHRPITNLPSAPVSIIVGGYKVGLPAPASVSSSACCIRSGGSVERRHLDSFCGGLPTRRYAASARRSLRAPGAALQRRGI